MIVLDIAHVAKSFGIDEVLKDISFSLNEGDRIGLVGVNGSGKTTLLKILNGELSVDEGVISLARGVKTGYLTQIFHPEPGASVIDVAREAFSDLTALEAKLRDLEKKMGDPDEADNLDNILRDYSRLTEQFERENGYEAASQVQGVLVGLGFTQEQFDQDASTLSGGELTRLFLARLLLQKPDLLLLDEPTNHLDMSALGWLENYLSTYPGTIVLVSHDRYFLNAVCNRMAEIFFGTIELYNGNYTSYLAQREERLASKNKAYLLQQKEIMRQRAIIARFKSFNREKSIKAAESREKALERMEILDRPQEEKQLSFRFQAKRLLGDIALIGEGLKKSFADRVLFENLDLDIRGGDRVALIGANGVGKTTLLRCLMDPDELDEGTVTYGPKAQVGYFDQRQLGLNPENDVLNEVWDAFPKMNQSQIRGALGLFLFSGDDVFTPISLLSGGEKSRVSLVKLMLRNDNFLILDEPTNHLDANSREALEKALEDYEGTILAVSHDRYFINRFANRVFVLDRDGIQAYDGNYDDYQAELAKLSEGEAEQAAEKTKTELARERRADRLLSEQHQSLKDALNKAEAEAHQAEILYNEAVSLQADPSVYQDPERAAAQALLCRQLQSKSERLFQRWIDAEKRLADFQAENKL
ncbi:MAG: ABC-F family ATP-binding cassette domain-containing protein [Bacillota bacterium]|nr:ABC-F family ATP-binding cassette domain-containing protein [Bacillota bacterium]